jgi:hypothetical protein
MAAFQFFTVHRQGGNRCEHASAVQLEPLVTELNRPGTLAVGISNDDPFLDNVREIEREVQVWRKGENDSAFKLWWQGRIDSSQLNTETMQWEVRCSGLLVYFQGLHVGRAGRTNHLLNGSFDDGVLAPWSSVGVTTDIVNQWGYLPDRSTHQVNLYQGGTGDDTFVQQRVDVPGRTYWTLSAWFHIRQDSDWVGPALDGRGLYIERRNPDNNEIEDVQFFAITDETQRGIYQRAVVNMWSADRDSSVFWVRLYATRCTNAHGSPPGSIIWDEVQLVAMESLSYSHVDLGDIIDGLVSHAQDPGFGKVYLGIDTPGAGSTGVLIDRFYQFVDHANIFDSLTEFSDAGLCDFDVEITWNDSAKKADKHVRCYFPRRGSSSKPYKLELDSTQSVSELTGLERNGENTRTTYIVQGEGSGPDREESSASDTSQTGGVVIEEIVQAPANTHHDLLPGIANEYVRKNHDVPQIPALVLAPFMTDKVELGDVYTTIADLGSVRSLQGNFRIVQMSHDFATDRLTVQVGKP